MIFCSALATTINLAFHGSPGDSLRAPDKAYEQAAKPLYWLLLDTMPVGENGLLDPKQCGAVVVS
jgi:hypothetical protein